MITVVKDVIDCGIEDFVYGKWEKMRRIILLTAVILTGCSGATPSPETAARFSVQTVIETSDSVWSGAAERLNETWSEYALETKAPSDEGVSFHRIESSDEGARLCLGPETKYDFAGNLTGFTPMSCSILDGQSPDVSLDKALQTWASRTIEAEPESSSFRAKILSASSPDNPVCYGVFPELFLHDQHITPYLEENYLIACAEKIDGGESWPENVAHEMAAQLRIEAALLSNQNSFIASAFKEIAASPSFESRMYGVSIEGYTELMSRKLRQAEITTIKALKASDDAKAHYLSRQNAMRLAYIAAVSETMTGDRLEAIVSALSPKENWPAGVRDYRQILQNRVCQMSVIIPDVTPGLVSGCLTWLKFSVRSSDDFDSALMLIEHGIYGAAENTPVIAENVLDWLRSLSLPEELAHSRHEFGQRISTHPQLTEEMRKVLLSF